MAGSRSAWPLPTATVASLTLRAGAIHAIKLNDIDPQAWLADVLERIASHPIQRLPELLPWHWRPATASISCNAA